MIGAGWVQLAVLVALTVEVVWFVVTDDGGDR